LPWFYLHMLLMVSVEVALHCECCIRGFGNGNREKLGEA